MTLSRAESLRGAAALLLPLRRTQQRAELVELLTPYDLLWDPETLAGGDPETLAGSPPAA